MKKNNKGFSLIDVVCAAAIIALVALPICSGFLSAAKSNQRIQTKTEIYNMLNNELSLILASGEVGLDSGITIDLETVTFSGEPLKPHYINSNANGEPQELGQALEKHMPDGKKLQIGLVPKQAEANNTKVAYITVTVTYDDPETADVENDYQVSGVWTE